MSRRFNKYTVIFCTLFLLNATCNTPFAGLFVPQYYSLTLLPPAGGGVYAVAQNGTVNLRFELRMGQGVRGEMMSTALRSNSSESLLTIINDAGKSLGELSASEAIEFELTIIAGPVVGSVSIPTGLYHLTA